MSWLNYHHLYYFWMIAKEGGVAKAAERLRLGQPTLSTQLKQLEDSLGHELFERRNRRLILTDSGKVAFNYAEEIFRLGNELSEVMNDKAPAKDRIHLQIGALDSMPKSLVMELVKQAWKISRCSVSILEGKGDELMRELQAHRVDLVLSNYPPLADEKRRVFSRSVAKVPIVVCGTPSFRHLKRNFPASLSGQPFIFPTPHSRLRHDLDHYFSLQGIVVDPVAETQDTSLQKIMGSEGLGLVPLPRSSAQAMLDSKQLVELGQLPAVFEEVWLISGERRIQNVVAAELFRSFRV